MQTRNEVASHTSDLIEGKIIREFWNKCGVASGYAEAGFSTTDEREAVSTFIDSNLDRLLSNDIATMSRKKWLDSLDFCFDTCGKLGANYLFMVAILRMALTEQDKPTAYGLQDAFLFLNNLILERNGFPKAHQALWEDTCTMCLLQRELPVIMSRQSGRKLVSIHFPDRSEC